MRGTSTDQLSGVIVFELKTEEYFENESEGVLTCVCVEIPDFYDSNDSNGSSPSGRFRFRRYYYDVGKTYCFITK